MVQDRQPVTLRSIALVAFVPPGLFSVAVGAVTPVIPVTASDLGASVALSAVVVALMSVGQLLADAPAGALAARFGEYRSMVAAGMVCGVALLVAMFSPALLAFALAIFMVGLGQAVWMLARQTFVADRVPFVLRARAMSTLGGVQRIGLLAGPLLGAGAMHFFGTRGAYGVAVVSVAVAVLVLVVVSDPNAAGERPSDAPSITYRKLLSEQRRVFLTVGLGVFLISIVRNSRQVIIPLWGDHIGLDPVTISLLFGLSTAVEVVLFYPAGKYMDLHGRRAAAVVCIGVQAAAHLALPFAQSIPILIVVAVALGIGSGMGSGLLMTIAADLAPPGQRSVFFGVWRLIQDSGLGAGPFVLAGMTSLLSLAAGAVVVGAIGVAGTAAMAAWIPRGIDKSDNKHSS